MTSPSANLLRLLEPAVRPAGAPGPAARPTGPVESATFDQLLRDAARLPLQIAPAAQTALGSAGAALSPQRLASIERAIDRARESGARHALILSGDLALVADVASRTIERSIPAADRSASPVTDIDAAVWAEPTQDPAPHHRIRL
jgi:hypothetical protein